MKSSYPDPIKPKFDLSKIQPGTRVKLQPNCYLYQKNRYAIIKSIRSHDLLNVPRAFMAEIFDFNPKGNLPPQRYGKSSATPDSNLWFLSKDDIIPEIDEHSFEYIYYEAWESLNAEYPGASLEDITSWTLSQQKARCSRKAKIHLWTTIITGILASGGVVASILHS